MAIIVQAEARRHSQMLRARQRNRLLRVRFTANLKMPTLTPNPAYSPRSRRCCFLELPRRRRCFLFELPKELRDAIFDLAFSGNTVNIRISHGSLHKDRWRLTQRGSSHPMDSLIASKRNYAETVQAFGRCTKFNLTGHQDLGALAYHAGNDLLQHIRQLSAWFTLDDTESLLSLAIACPRLETLKLRSVGRMHGLRTTSLELQCLYRQHNVEGLRMLAPMLLMRPLKAFSLEVGRCQSCSAQEWSCGWYSFGEVAKEYVLTNIERKDEVAYIRDTGAVAQAKAVALGFSDKETCWSLKTEKMMRSVEIELEAYRPSSKPGLDAKHCYFSGG